MTIHLTSEARSYIRQHGGEVTLAVLSVGG